MAFTKSTCTESGTWAGHCRHGDIVVNAGERFPDCPGCRRGIDWHRVGPVGATGRRDPRRNNEDWVDEGWWPEKGH